MRFRSLLGVISVLVLTSCGGTGPSSTMPEAEVTTDGPVGAWMLVEAEPAIEVPDGARITMTVTAAADGWQVGGTSACNEYGGTVTIDGGSWDGQGFGGTDMACEDPRMMAERAYLDALETIEGWARTSVDELVLTGAHVELRFTALAPVPIAALTGTTWVLEALVSGSGPDATVTPTALGAEPAILELASDGTVEATTGCRSFAGEWTEAGDELLLTTFGQRDDSPNVAADGTTTCDDAVVAQERHVLSVLGDGFHATVDGPRLTLSSRDGLGLRYTGAGR
jgi:heat shock protein HslJ